MNKGRSGIKKLLSLFIPKMAYFQYEIFSTLKMRRKLGFDTDFWMIALNSYTFTRARRKSDRPKEK